MQLSKIKKLETNLVLKTDNINLPSELTRDYRVDVVLLPTDRLKPYNLQARQLFDAEEIENLAETIKLHGVLNPLTVSHDEQDGKFQIVSGERRWRASKIAGLERVPCIVIKNNNATQEIAIIENIQRKDLHPVELLEGIEALISNNPDLSKEELYKRIGLSKTVFYRILSLVKLSKEARKLGLEKKLSMDKLVDIAKAHPEMQVQLINSNRVGEEQTPKPLQAILDRASNSPSQVFEIKLKQDRLEVKSNFMALSEKSRSDAIQVLKNILQQLEKREI